MASDEELEEALKAAQKAAKDAKPVEKAGKSAVVKAALERKTGNAKNGGGKKS